MRAACDTNATTLEVALASPLDYFVLFCVFAQLKRKTGRGPGEPLSRASLLHFIQFCFILFVLFEFAIRGLDGG